MKKLPQNLDDLLLDYLDGNLRDDQRKSVEESIASDPLIRQRLEELSAAHVMMKNITADIPPSNFTTNVMSGLKTSPSRPGLSIRNGLLLLAGIVMVMTIAVILLSAGVFDQSTTVDLNRVSIPDAIPSKYIRQLPSFSFDGKTMVNIIILLNLVLAFIVLDRAVLKPFFQKRMEAGH